MGGGWELGRRSRGVRNSSFVLRCNRSVFPRAVSHCGLGVPSDAAASGFSQPFKTRPVITPLNCLRRQHGLVIRFSSMTRADFWGNPVLGPFGVTHAVTYFPFCTAAS